MTQPDTDMSKPVMTAIDFGRKNGDYTAIAQWSADEDGGYTLRSISRRKLPPIRSKAQVKRLLKRLDSYNPVLDLLYCRGGKTKRRVRPVSWQEIVTHDITVSA